MSSNAWIATATLLVLTACGHGKAPPSDPQNDSAQPKMAEPAPTDSTYSGAAGRTEDPEDPTATAPPSDGRE
jgi:hypothetical protein